MKLTRKENNAKPIVTDSGECLYEMLGTASHLGSARHQSLACSVIPPGKYSAAHFHKISEETLYIIEGEGRLIVDGKAFDVRADDACLISPGEVHSISNLSSDSDLKLLAITSPPWSESDAYPAEGSHGK